MTNVWTPDQVKHHVEAVMEERDKRYEGRFRAQEHALQLALEAEDRGIRKGVAIAGVVFGIITAAGILLTLLLGRLE